MSSKDLTPRRAGPKTPYRHQKSLYDSSPPSLASQLETTPANRQTSSPLFRSFPAELRLMIFQHALTESYGPGYKDPSDRHESPLCTECALKPAADDDNESNPLPRLWSTRENYWWPEQASHKTLSCALLRTCRAIHFETRFLPPANKEHVFWLCSYAPPGVAFRSPAKYFRRFTRAQLAHVGRVHLFMSQWRLERQLLATCESPLLAGLRVLAVTIRRCDWDWGRVPRRWFVLDAYRGFADPLDRNRGTELVDMGGAQWNERGWGLALRCLPGLEEFRLQLECAEDDVESLDHAVAVAETWEFPCYDSDYVFSSRGREARTWIWKRPLRDWECDFCGGETRNEDLEAMTAEEEEEDEMGRTRVVKVIKWKKVKAACAADALT